MQKNISSVARLETDRAFLHALATPIAVLKFSLKALEGRRNGTGEGASQIDPAKISKMLEAISDLERIHADFKSENFRRIQEDRDPTAEF